MGRIGSYLFVFFINGVPILSLVALGVFGLVLFISVVVALSGLLLFVFNCGGSVYLLALASRCLLIDKP